MSNPLDSGAGSLRQAVLDVNITAGADNIVFDASFNSATTITLGGTQLPAFSDTTGATTINGPGANLLTISGNNLSRVMEVVNGVAVSISGVTISGGKVSGGVGGGILNFGTLTVSNSTVSGNSSSQGGGIYNLGTMILASTTLSGNSASNGGGICDASMLTVTNSTLSGNVADFGGAILSNGSLAVSNSTLSGNSAGISAGGIYSGGTLAVTSSIISGNLAGTAPDIKSYFSVNVNFSAIGASQGFMLSGSSGNNLAFQPFANLKLGGLANNGGAMLTHLPANDSPLIHAGSNPQSLTTDQRGLARVSGPQPDIGAVEISPEAQSLIVTISTDVVDNFDFKTSLREAINYANTKAGVDTITFDASFNSATTITLGGTQLPTLTDALTINGPGANLLTINGNNLSRVLEVAAGVTVSISGVTVSGGKSTGGQGGGILNSGTLTVTNSTLSGNTAGTHGGGVYSTSTLTVTNSTLSGNSAGFNGGGIVNNGSATVANSTISGNSAGINGTGGGITSSYGAPATITNSTISGNFAVFGGGIFHRGTLTVTNSTIIGNFASNSGGGIRNFEPSPGTRTVTSCIISGNVSPNGPDIFTNIAVNVNFSAIGSSQGFTLSGSSGNNLAFQPFANLKLGALSNNGGATLTHLPANDSPLINTGSNPQSLSTDQRGLARVSGIQADIGAVEVDGPQEAQSLIVTATNDTVNFFDFKTSLREAIIFANTKAGADTITFDASFNSASTITLGGTQLPTLSDKMGATTIAGTGANQLTINGNNLSRVLEVAAGATGSISGVTVSGGKSTGGQGGGILNSGTLTVTNSTLSGNTADFGGAVYSTSKLTVTNSTLSGNSAGFNGGGLVNNSSLILTNSTISGNSAGINGTGGGITSSYGAPATITNSTISGNFAVFGGGIFHRGTLTVTNSTIIGNFASNSGGGIRNFEPSPGTRTVTSCIVSGNLSPNGPDIFTNIAVNLNFSAIGSSQGFTLSGSSGNNLAFQPFANLKLGGLANNGGTTLTHALLADSPCLNAGSNPMGLTTDQRGKARAVGNIDIGAFELQPAAKVSSVVIGDGTAQRSMVTQLKVTFDSPIIFSGPPAAAFTLLRQSDSKAVNLAVAMDPTNTIATITFTGGAVDNKSLADGRYTLNVLAAQIGADGLDGDGNGTGGDNYVLVGAPGTAPNLFRIFGDANGDGSVAADDFIQFRLSLGGSNPIFDFDGDGAVAASDFIQFRLRFGGSV